MTAVKKGQHVRGTSAMDQTEEERSVQDDSDGTAEVVGALSRADDLLAIVVGENDSELEHDKVEVECSPNTAAEPEVDVQKQQPQQRSAVDGDIKNEFPRKECVGCDDVDGEPAEGQPPPEGVDADANGYASRAAQSEPTAIPSAGLNDNSSIDDADMIQSSSTTQDAKPPECLADTEVEADGEKSADDKGMTLSTGRDQQGGLRKALVGFYGVHNPERIGNLDVILKQYAGKEDLLIERLEQKYSADLSYARRAAGMAERYPSGDVPPRPGPSAGGAPAPRQPRPVRSSHHFFSAGDVTMPGRDNAVAAAAAAAPAHAMSRISRGAPEGQAAAIAQGGGASSAMPSASYMTYLADQIRYNVEGFLPASSGGGGGNTSSGGRSATLGRMSSPTRVATAAAQRRLRPQYEYKDAADRPANTPAATVHSAGLSATAAAATDDPRPISRPMSSRYGAPLGQGARASTAFFVPSENSSERGRGEGLERVGETDVVGGSFGGGQHQEAADPVLLARVKALEEERAGLVSACRRLQSKAEAAVREAAATEELRDAGQRKIAGFAERAAVSERQARDAVARLRSLEVAQAGLKAEKEKSAGRCAAKHAQLLSAIDVQASLRSQLEGLLDVIPPSLYSAPAKTQVQPRGEESESGAVAAVCNIASPVPVPDESSAGDAAAATSGYLSPEEGGVGNGDNDGGGGDESAGGGVDELKRRCAALGISLRASRREALEARRARDAAEITVRKQRETLTTLEGTVSELKEALEKEKEARQIAVRAVSGLESELDLQLSSLRAAEARLSDRDDENARLKEELRGASARLQNASAARAALLSFCRQERTAVELAAAEHVSRTEESAGMRGEEGLAKGLELADMAIEAGEKKAAALEEEIDRLGKALFDARAELAGSEARAQALRRELGRAVETIAGLSSRSAAGGSGDVGATAVTAAGAGAKERGASDGERAGGEAETGGISPSAARSGKLAAVDSRSGGARVVGDADVGAAIKAAVAAATATPPPEETSVSSGGPAGVAGGGALVASDSFWMCAEVPFGRGKSSTGKRAGRHPAGYDVEL